MSLQKHITPRNKLILIDIPWYYRSEGEAAYQAYLVQVDDIFDAVAAEHKAVGGLLNQLITKHGQTLIKGDKYHEHVYISIVGRLLDRPLELLLANLKDMRADLSALNPREGICQHIDGSLGRLVGVRNLVRTMFSSLPDRDPSATFPVAGKAEYESRQSAATLWENPKRIRLLDVMIWELENRPEAVLANAFAKIPAFMWPFWSKGYDAETLPPKVWPAKQQVAPPII